MSNGLLFKAKTGEAWRGPAGVVWAVEDGLRPVRRWSRAGTRSALVAQVQVIAELDREVSVGSSIVRRAQRGR
ncbi:hypothetical protein [Amycolatopsis jejuensis]|uniref:hypothetical protein n=1 Tax=Amycolatopsis jejuensis TaxID=330084 RepID=UPI000524CC5D|nr:hypothetical protein [Amycolatopsis jejuensis]